jgi:prepilin-type N-terminal cleavage/methylation domain-containing protein
MFSSQSKTEAVNARRLKVIKTRFLEAVQHQQGLTVVELLIALMILVIVSASGYMFFGYGLRAFDTGTERSIVNNNLRMAAEAITNEVRFAEAIAIIDASDIPDPVGDDIYLYINNAGRIERKDQDESRIIPHELDSDIILELGFEKQSSNVLKVIITETNSNIALETEIQILNIAGSNSIENSSGNTIRIGSNGSGDNPGITPVISSMVTIPEQHFAGTAQSVDVTVNTQNVSDGTVITVDFINTDAATVLYSALATINNNSASTVITLPGSLQAGIYIIKASGVGIPQYLNKK